ncbi:MAG: hypothetical protein R3321_11825, partial [Nitrososphaeraceae archaeon]|nr:hypothetical protein [Nitrososphaeraceae archaeon]
MMTTEVKQYSQKSLLETDREFSDLPTKVVLTGKTLTVAEIIAVARHNARVELTDDKAVLSRIRKSYEMMMQQVKEGIP